MNPVPDPTFPEKFSGIVGNRTRDLLADRRTNHYAKVRYEDIFKPIVDKEDRLIGIVVSTSDCHPRGPGFDSRL